MIGCALLTRSTYRFREIDLINIKLLHTPSVAVCFVLICWNRYEKYNLLLHTDTCFCVTFFANFVFLLRQKLCLVINCFAIILIYALLKITNFCLRNKSSYIHKFFHQFSSELIQNNFKNLNLSNTKIIILFKLIMY